MTLMYTYIYIYSIKILNKTKPNIEPCGTQENIKYVEENFPKEEVQVKRNSHTSSQYCDSLLKTS
jgi:hypothetical protein